MSYRLEPDGTLTQMSPCGYCGQWHDNVCPRVKAMEYHPDGTIKRVEFHPTSWATSLGDVVEGGKHG